MSIGPLHLVRRGSWVVEVRRHMMLCYSYLSVGGEGRDGRVWCDVMKGGVEGADAAAHTCIAI